MRVGIKFGCAIVSQVSVARNSPMTTGDKLPNSSAASADPLKCQPAISAAAKASTTAKIIGYGSLCGAGARLAGLRFTVFRFTGLRLVDLRFAGARFVPLRFAGERLAGFRALDFRLVDFFLARFFDALAIAFSQAERAHERLSVSKRWLTRA